MSFDEYPCGRQDAGTSPSDQYPEHNWKQLERPMSMPEVLTEQDHEDNGRSAQSPVAAGDRRPKAE